MSRREKGDDRRSKRKDWGNMEEMETFHSLIHMDGNKAGRIFVKISYSLP
jgi:hypothetical protein